MEMFGNAHTAQELFEFLSQIPQCQRERLPLEIFATDEDLVDVHLSAFETTETEGCIERGFRLEYTPY